MKLYVMFGQREESYDGQYAPEALDFSWDEYSVEENSDGFEKAIKEAEETAKKNGFIRTKLFAIEVDQDAIHRALNEVPTLKGKLVP